MTLEEYVEQLKLLNTMASVEEYRILNRLAIADYKLSGRYSARLIDLMANAPDMSMYDDATIDASNVAHIVNMAQSSVDRLVHLANKMRAKK